MKLTKYINENRVIFSWKAEEEGVHDAKRFRTLNPTYWTSFDAAWKHW